jgi:hypothetical protein
LKSSQSILEFYQSRRDLVSMEGPSRRLPQLYTNGANCRFAG